MTDFDINSDPKTWTTRDGQELDIFTTQATGETPIVGQIKGSTVIYAWTGEGKHCKEYECYRDLISPRKTVKVDFWVNVYADNRDMSWSHVTSWSSKRSADDHAQTGRIACKHFVMEVEEGEFDG